VTAAASFNLGNRPDRDVARGLDRIVSHGADIMGLQEAGDRTRLLLSWCTSSGWSYFGGNGEDGAPSTPIIWNPAAVRVSHKGTRPATPATDCGRLGAGPNVVKPKVWNHIHVDRPDGDPFVHINGHLPASLYLPRRRALAKKQVAVLAGMVADRKRHGIDVVLTMDGNCGEHDPLWRPLKQLGMKQHTKAPTHGRRCIDLTWTLGVGGRAEVVTVPSDHKAVVLSLR
jgi:hypothetical protein